MSNILYVEDEPDDVFIAQHACRRAGFKHALAVARDGAEAIDYLAGRGAFADRARYPMPDLVILDVNLPVRSGFDVLAWIREQPGLKSLRVLIYSSSAAESDRARAEVLGADEFLVKPSGLPETRALFADIRSRYFPGLLPAGEAGD
jgi:CheY-like chemotaxis protein